MGKEFNTGQDFYKLERDLIIMTEIDDGVMTDLSTTEVINAYLLQEITDRLKCLMPDLIEEITKVTVILLQEIPLSIIHS